MLSMLDLFSLLINTPSGSNIPLIRQYSQHILFLDIRDVDGRNSISFILF